MKNTLFREKSIDRVSSPEQLNDRIRVANPGVWLLLAGIGMQAANIRPTLEQIKPIMDAVPEASEDKKMVTKVSGGADTRYETDCWSNYHCQLNHKFDGTGTDIVCMLDYLCSYLFNDPDQWDDMVNDMF